MFSFLKVFLLYYNGLKKYIFYRQKQMILELKKQSSWNVFMVNYRNEKSSKYIVIWKKNEK
jgi:hypothetical protein